MKKSAKLNSRSITGRDGYIMAQALAYAIEAIEHLPDDWQEWSNKEDMKLLLNNRWKVMAKNLRIGARGHLEQIGFGAAMEKSKKRVIYVPLREKAA
jgi:predicted metal-dependent hydrolase